jgi:hypothetical protein
MDKNLDKLYFEASNSVRHYSGLILSLKNTTIAQGFAILAAQGYFYQTKAYSQSLLLGCFGILFTLTLHLIGRNLMGHFDISLDIVQRIEQELSAEHDSLGPWTAFDATSLRHRGHLLVRSFTLHGHVFLLLIAFFCIVAYDVAMLFSL